MTKVYRARGLKGSERYQSPQTPIIAVQPGDKVRLDWYGDSALPMWCNKSWARVVQTNRKRIVVQPDVAQQGFHLSVLPERHVIDWRKGTK